MFPLLFMNTEPTQRDTATAKEDESEDGEEREGEGRPDTGV